MGKYLQHQKQQARAIRAHNLGNERGEIATADTRPAGFTCTSSIMVDCPGKDNDVCCVGDEDCTERDFCNYNKGQVLCGFLPPPTAYHYSSPTAYQCPFSPTAYHHSSSIASKVHFSPTAYHHSSTIAYHHSSPNSFPSPLLPTSLTLLLSNSLPIPLLPSGLPPLLPNSLTRPLLPNNLPPVLPNILPLLPP